MTLDDGLNQVLPYVEGCPDMLALLHLRNAAIEFCERTLVWQATLSPIVTVLNQRTYPFAPALPAGATVAKLLSVKRDTQPMELMTEATTDASTTGVDAAGTNALRSALVLGLPPTAGRQLLVRAALKPSRTATDIDDGLFEQYIEAIAHGAIGRLQSLPNKEWTADPSLALGKFEQAVANATATVLRAGSRLTVPAQPSYF